MKKFFKHFWWAVTHLPQYFKRRKRNKVLAPLHLVPPHYKTVILDINPHPLKDASGSYVNVTVGRLDDKNILIQDYKRKICLKIPFSVPREDWEFYILRQEETKPNAH